MPTTVPQLEHLINWSLKFEFFGDSISVSKEELEQLGFGHFEDKAIAML